MTDTDDSQNPRARWMVFVGVWLIYFCFGVIVASMGPLITPIGAELGIGDGGMGLILGAWPLVYIFAAIPCGVLLDRIGVRRVLFLSTLIMAASGLARSVSDSQTQLLLAVAIFGIGGPMISVGAPKVIAGLFSGTTRATALGVYITGPYLGALLSLSLTNSVAMPLVGYDWRGVMLLYAGFVGLSGVIWLGLTHWAAIDLDGGKGKTVNLSAFVGILTVPEVRLILSLSIGIFFINHALNNWLPEILLSKGMTAVTAGYWAAIPSAIGVVGALIIPRFATPERRIPIMAGLFCASLMASVLLQTAPGPLLASGLVLQGVARGAMMTLAILLLMETPSVPPERLGLAGGMFFTAAEVGGVLGPVTFGVLSGASGAFTLPLIAVTVVCILSLILLARLHRLGQREF